MNTFKRKALFTAVAAGLAGVAGSAEAVYMNPLGTGQALVFPYYTVQSVGNGAYNTAITVVNTTSRAKVVKVRFLEGKTSAEVLDFNLYLSPNDVWTGAVIPSSSTAGAAARLVTTDVSCTSPAIAGAPASPAGPGFVDFRNFFYASGAGGANLPGTGLDRTREGYVEMIEMGVVTGTTATAVTHGASGIPPGCATVQALGFNPFTIGTLVPPQGGLMGTGTLINVGNGLVAGYRADALEAWNNWGNGNQFTDPGSLLPTLSSAFPPISLVMNIPYRGDATNNGLDPATLASMLTTAYLSLFAVSAGTGTPGAKAVASVFMHQSVMNEYSLDAGTQSNADWVVTQPLKRDFVTSTVALPPYSNTLTASGACEIIQFTYFNREERTATPAPGDFSPTPPGAQPNSMCWEANVISLRNAAPAPTGQVSATTSGVLGSVNSTNITLGANTLFPNGWAVLDFMGVNATGVGLISAAGSQRVALNQTGLVPAAAITTAPTTFFGLPATGFMVRTLINASVTCAAVPPATGTTTCATSFSNANPHSYRNNIVP